MKDSTLNFILSRENLDCFFENELAFYGLPRERISDLLLSQLLICRKLRIFNIFHITDEIKYLEGITRQTRTVKEKPFKGDRLMGALEKAFLQRSFSAKKSGQFSFKQGRIKSI